jgi:3',5'-cyclic AMP phosphodiesterase CpdA
MTLRFGLIADIQYGDLPDRERCRFREVPARLARVVAALNDARLDFVVQLGDVIDGRGEAADMHADLDVVLDLLGGLDAPLVHVLGNHGLHLPRAELCARLGLDAPRRRFDAGGARFLVLDSMELSIQGHPPGHPRAREAAAWLAAHPRAEFPEANEWNGGLGAEQRAWLARELADAAVAGLPVVALAHHPLLGEASAAHYRAWDHAETLAVLDAYPALRAWINGHYHPGGHAARAGVWHWTLRGLVEEEAAAWVELEPGGLRVHGIGSEADRWLAWG